jgi:hypothetical protein
MIYRLVFILLIATGQILAQPLYVIPEKLPPAIVKLNTNGLDYQVQTIQNSLQACGQFNQQFSATLISNQGLLLVSRAALFSYLPDGIDPEEGYWARNSDEERPLKSSFVSFQLDARDVTTELLKGVEEVSENKRASLIARNRVQLRMQQQVEPGQSVQIRSLDQDQVFFLYRMATFTDLRLVGLPATADQQAFALIRIYTQVDGPEDKLKMGQQAMQNRVKIPLAEAIKTTDSLSLYSIDFPEQSAWHSSSFELALHIQAYELTQALDQSRFDIYQQFGVPVPQKYIDQYKQREKALAYFEQNDILARKKAAESQLILDPGCRKALTGLQSAYNELQESYLLQTYAQEGFNRLQLYRLSIFLAKVLKTSPERYEKIRPSTLQFLENWQKDWNPVLDEALFAPMAEAYFSRTKAKYLSPKIIEQISVTAKSYSELGELIYSSTLLTRPDLVKDLLQQDLGRIQRALEKDLGYQFMDQFSRDLNEKLQRPARKQQNAIKSIQRAFSISKKALLQDEWVSDANGSLSIHFSKLPPSAIEASSTALVPVPGTDFAPLLNTNGQAIGFRLENPAESLAYIWWLPKQDPPSFPILSSSSLLNYLAAKPTTQKLLAEIKKAP